MERDMNEEQMQLQLRVPQELETGSYSNLLAVWHTPHEFTLDFAVLGPQDGASESEQGLVTVPVVARIKVPTNVIFNIARAIADNVNKYEEQFGPITSQPDSMPKFPPRGDGS